MNGNILVTDIDDKYGIGQRAHILDTAKRPFQLRLLAMMPQNFLFGQAFE